MKHLIWIAALLILSTACGTKEESAPAGDGPVAREETPAPAPAADRTADDAVERALEVVEESAAVEEEDQNEPIVLASAAANDGPAREWQFRAGAHYERMVPTQPTVGGAGKIEVAEIFMYSCPHCFDLEPRIDRWSESLDPGVRFVRIPAQFNQVAVLHAQIYYTHEILARNGKLADPRAFHMAVFAEFHRRGNRLTSQAVIRRLFERFGVSAEDFDKTWGSFEVDQKLRVAADLTRRYNILSVPAVVVNGKYRVPNSARVLEIADELIVREGIR